MSDVQTISGSSRWSALWRLMRFDRPIGILLLLWPTLWALWIAAGGLPSLRNLLIFSLGVVVMRAAGCVMNDIADRDFDPHVERTRGRPLASGELSVRAASTLLLALLVLAFVLVLFTNKLTITLAFAGAALALTYPFFKRITHLPQVVLGVAFGWSIPMAFAAERGAIPPEAWGLLVINTVWAVVYDTLYAMVDREDDLKVGIKSTAILFGTYDLVVLRVLMGVMLALLGGLGLLLDFGWPWYAAMTCVAGLFIHQLRLAKGRQRDQCFKAFLHNNWVGLALFAGLVVQYLRS